MQQLNTNQNPGNDPGSTKESGPPPKSNGLVPEPRAPLKKISSESIHIFFDADIQNATKTIPPKTLDPRRR